MSKRQIAALAAVVLVPIVVLVIVLISTGSSDDGGGGTTTESSAQGPQSSNSSPGEPGSTAGAPSSSGSGGSGERSATVPDVTLPVLSGGSGPLAKKVAPATSGKKLDLGNLRGTPVVVNLWSSWCQPCRSGIRVAQAASQTFAERGVLFLGFAVQDKPADALRFQKSLGITYPTAQDPSGDAARRLGATGLPATFFISSDGQIVGQVRGPATFGQIELGAVAAKGGNPLGTRQGGIQVPLR